MRVFGLAFILIPSLFFGASAHKPGSRLRSGRAHKKKHVMTVDAGAINNPMQPPIAEGAKGSAVVRAQILLDRAHFSCGEIDGNFGTNLQKTLAAYQDDRKLPATNAVDDATWAALNADNAPALASVTIAPEDQTGPFQELPADLMKQALLPSPGYASPLEELAERFHASPALLQALNPGADFTKIGQPLTVPNVLTMPPGKAENIVVSKADSSVRVSGADGKLLAFYVATIGSQHDPLPIGTWEILGVQRNPIFHYNAQLFWDAHDPNEKAEIKAGPRNPAGLVWIELSKQHYGIHGTPKPALIGHASSHGCIRLTNWDALEVASMVKKGTRAILKE